MCDGEVGKMDDPSCVCTVGRGGIEDRTDGDNCERAEVNSGTRYCLMGSVGPGE